jgi:hypothetical protein
MKRFLKHMLTWTGEPCDWAIAVACTGFLILYLVG